MKNIVEGKFFVRYVTGSICINLLFYGIFNIVVFWNNNWQIYIWYIICYGISFGDIRLGLFFLFSMIDSMMFSFFMVVVIVFEFFSVIFNGLMECFIFLFLLLDFIMLVFFCGMWFSMRLFEFLLFYLIFNRIMSFLMIIFLYLCLS